ncbi:MAG: hypothetical protein C0601_05595 [Candidatus Muiribacterium halophilum]|uniref:VTC domain-containing protein n=1 Tax=Muiribacterium halophilum TaxID=2053465 RepID=A0A2N5ZHH2_MUIH1|nr:MAG: hypothetical protein C0601_05595 [Candidatus Muirbacterium halophilum]
MKKKPRFERKYRISKTEYFSILNTIRPFIEVDPIAAKKGGRYFVRSLYFDSFGYHSYSEKVAGVSDRIKLRIRAYGKDLKDTDIISFEIKTKRADKIVKYSSKILPDQYFDYLGNGHLSYLEDPVLEEFFRLKNIYHLEGVIIVDYERDAFYAKGDDGVRITFDHDVRSASSNKLFPKEEEVIFRSGEPQVVVMEIKTQKSHPYWLSDVCKRFGLDQKPNSKFALGIENSAKSILR